MALQPNQESIIFTPLLDNPLHNGSSRPQNPLLPQGSSLKTPGLTSHMKCNVHWKNPLTETKLFWNSEPPQTIHTTTLSKKVETNKIFSFTADERQSLLHHFKPPFQASGSITQEIILKANLQPFLQWRRPATHHLQPSEVEDIAVADQNMSTPPPVKERDIEISGVADEDVEMEGQILDNINQSEEIIQLDQVAQPPSFWNSHPSIPLNIHLQLPTTNPATSGPTTINVNIAFIGVLGPESQPGVGGATLSIPPIAVTADVAGPLSAGSVGVGTSDVAPTALGVLTPVGTPTPVPSPLPPSQSQTPRRRPIPLPDPKTIALPAGRVSGSRGFTPTQIRPAPLDNNVRNVSVVTLYSSRTADDSGRTVKPPSHADVPTSTLAFRDGNLNNVSQTASPPTLLASTADTTLTSTSSTGGVSYTSEEQGETEGRTITAATPPSSSAPPRPSGEAQFASVEPRASSTLAPIGYEYSNAHTNSNSTTNTDADTHHFVIGVNPTLSNPASSPSSPRQLPTSSLVLSPSPSSNNQLQLAKNEGNSRLVHPLPPKPTWTGQGSNLTTTRHIIRQSGSKSVATGSVSARPSVSSSSGTRTGPSVTSSTSLGQQPAASTSSGTFLDYGYEHVHGGVENQRSVAMIEMRGAEAVMSPHSEAGDLEGLEFALGKTSGQKRKRSASIEEEDQDEVEMQLGLENRRRVPPFKVVRPHGDWGDDGDQLRAEDLDMEALSIEGSATRAASVESLEEGEIRSGDEQEPAYPALPAIPSHMRSVSLESGETHSRFATPSFPFDPASAGPIFNVQQFVQPPPQDHSPMDVAFPQQVHTDRGIPTVSAQNAERGADTSEFVTPNQDDSEPMDVDQDPTLVEPHGDEVVQAEQNEMELEPSHLHGSSASHRSAQKLMAEIFGDSEDEDEVEIVGQTRIRPPANVDDDEENDFSEVEFVEETPAESKPWYSTLSQKSHWAEANDSWDGTIEISAGPSPTRITAQAPDSPRADYVDENRATSSTPRGRQPTFTKATTLSSGGSKKSAKGKQKANKSSATVGGPANTNSSKRIVKASRPLHSKVHPPTSVSEDEHDELDEDENHASRPSTSTVGNTSGRERGRTHQKPHSTGASSSKRSISQSHSGQGRRPRSSSNSRSRSQARSAGSRPRLQPLTLIKMLNWANELNNVHYVLCSNSIRRTAQPSFTTLAGPTQTDKLLKIFKEMKQYTRHPNLTLQMLADSNLITILSKFKHKDLKLDKVYVGVELPDNVKSEARKLIYGFRWQVATEEWRAKQLVG